MQRTSRPLLPPFPVELCSDSLGIGIELQDCAQVQSLVDGANAAQVDVHLHCWR